MLPKTQCLAELSCYRTFVTTPLVFFWGGGDVYVDLFCILTCLVYIQKETKYLYIYVDLSQCITFWIYMRHRTNSCRSILLNINVGSTYTIQHNSTQFNTQKTAPDSHGNGPEGQVEVVRKNTTIGPFNSFQFYFVLEKGNDVMILVHAIF